VNFIKTVIPSILGLISSCFVFLFENIDINLKYLIIVVILDFISGIFKAFVKKKINSSIGVKGVLKKFSYFIVVAISKIIGNILNIGNLLLRIVIYSLVFNEIVSILENCTEMGIKLPKLLISSLEIFSSKIDEYNEMDLELNDKEKAKDK